MKSLYTRLEKSKDYAKVLKIVSNFIESRIFGTFKRCRISNKHFKIKNMKTESKAKLIYESIMKNYTKESFESDSKLLSCQKLSKFERETSRMSFEELIFNVCKGNKKLCSAVYALAEKELLN